MKKFSKSIMASQGDECEERTCYTCVNCILEFTKKLVAYLQRQHFLIIEHGRILPTPLGKAAFTSSIPPEESRQIFADLVDARQTQLVLETDLHLLYLITPHFKGLREPNWNAFIKQFKRLTKAELLVADVYQITAEYLQWAREIRP
jgi:hypothetical protein